MRARSALLLAIFAGCSQALAGDDRADTGRVKHHMRQRIEDLRTIERLLVTGKLEEARALAFMLTRPADLVPGDPNTRAFTLAAGALVNARTVDDALYAAARTASACAQCHVATQKLPVFRTPSQAPPDRPTMAAQMARHQWAADRLWEGIVGDSDAHWRAGLYVLATSPLPHTTTKAPDIAVRMQQLARKALDEPPPTLDARAEVYGDLLVTCAGCHSAPLTAARPRRR